jgi:hypothetical protein
MVKIRVVTCLFLLASVCLGAQEAADALWSKGLFKANAAEIIAAARNSSYPGENDVVILYKQGRFRFTEGGSLAQTTQLVYQILSEDGLKGWGDVQLSWSPWHQDRPGVRVRVINADGKDWYLDPKTLVEGNATGEGDNVYSDRKTLEAPFPQVHIGFDHRGTGRERLTADTGGRRIHSELELFFPDADTRQPTGHRSARVPQGKTEEHGARRSFSPEQRNGRSRSLGIPPYPAIPQRQG